MSFYIVVQKRKVLKLDISKISFVKAQGNYSIISHAETEIICCKQIGRVAKELKDAGFVRVNKSHLINSAYFESITSLENKNNLVLSDGNKFEIARRRLSKLKTEILD